MQLSQLSRCAHRFGSAVYVLGSTRYVHDSSINCSQQSIIQDLVSRELLFQGLWHVSANQLTLPNRHLLCTLAFCTNHVQGRTHQGIRAFPRLPRSHCSRLCRETPLEARPQWETASLLYPGNSFLADSTRKFGPQCFGHSLLFPRRNLRSAALERSSTLPDCPSHLWNIWTVCTWPWLDIT